MKRIILLAVLAVGFCLGADEVTIVTVETDLGSFEIQMLEDAAPATATNFLNYVTRGDYNGSFLHRSVPGFIVQGGGFFFDSTTGEAPPIPTDLPVVNEFGLSNTRATVAMAKLGGDPNSATSQWFVNLADNSENLDEQNGGFTVFGRVLGQGMGVVDAIAALPRTNFGSPFNETPTINFSGGAAQLENFVNIQMSAFVVADTDSDGIIDSIDDDDDNDGAQDENDAFPLDPSETEDTDDDGTGDNSDTDDDNDGMPDAYEIENSLDSLDASDADDDADADGATNLQEFNFGTDPNDGASVDDCLGVDVVPPDPADSALLISTRVYFANPASNLAQQSFLRVVNPNSSDTDIEIYGIDDAGNRNKRAPVSFTLVAQASIQINAQDLESGNRDKGLNSSFCNGQGKWQLQMRSNNTIQVTSLIRTPDGFLTSVNDTVPSTGSTNQVFFANPASNNAQQTFLRIVNTSDSTGVITISGLDDMGVNSMSPVTFDLGANASKQINVQDLENGNVGKGLMGSLGDGSGKWRLTVTSALEIEVMSLIRTPDGFLTNLSGMVDTDGLGNHLVYFVNPALTIEKQSFLRVINTTGQTSTVSIAGVDDAGNIALSGDVSFELGGNRSLQINASDLEQGNANKGLMGMLGAGSGRWRLTVSADTDIEVMSLIRTPDGFLTNLSRTTPKVSGINKVFMFNPGSNLNQRSSLRIVNNSGTPGNASITGIDDSGNTAPGDTIALSISANSAVEITAQDIENGNAQLGLEGALGDGAGKWRLEINSDLDLKIQSLLNTTEGFLTNLSQVTE
ncbi:MAG: peptidylprolyl isomerase [Pseudomonadales bacterium]|nr:peptidylprolyl isomerase [Pseudomonadales bacterium]